MATVQHLFRAPKKRLPMEELTEVSALENSGLAGCAHARPGSPRQVLLVDSETLELMELPPGTIRENITTRGINAHLPPVDEWPAALLDLLPPDAPRNNWRRTLLRVLARMLYPSTLDCTASESC